MSTLTLRVTKGGELTYQELDDNFSNLNTDKLQNVVEDTTPELGGELNLSGFKITDTTAGNAYLPQLDHGLRITKDIPYFWNTFQFDKGAITGIEIVSTIDDGTYQSSVNNLSIPLISIAGDTPFGSFNAGGAGLAGFIDRPAFIIAQANYPNAASLLPVGTAYDINNPIPDLGSPTILLSSYQISAYPDFPEFPGAEAAWHTMQYQVHDQTILQYNGGFVNAGANGINGWANSSVTIPHTLNARESVSQGYSNVLAGNGAPIFYDILNQGVIPKKMQVGWDSTGLYDGTTNIAQFDMFMDTSVWSAVYDFVTGFGSTFETQFYASLPDTLNPFDYVELLNVFPTQYDFNTSTGYSYSIEGPLPEWVDFANNKLVLPNINILNDLLNTGTTGALDNIEVSWRVKQGGATIVFYDFKISASGGTSLGNGGGENGHGYLDRSIDLRTRVVKTASPYNVVDYDKVIIINKTTAGAQTVNLPSVVSKLTGRSFTIKDGKGDANINPITIVPATGETIDGQTSAVINTSYSSITIVNSGTEWNII